MKLRQTKDREEKEKSLKERAMKTAINTERGRQAYRWMDRWIDKERLSDKDSRKQKGKPTD